MQSTDGPWPPQNSQSPIGKTHVEDSCALMPSWGVKSPMAFAARQMLATMYVARAMLNLYRYDSPLVLFLDNEKLSMYNYFPALKSGPGG
jgi:hypothetical protein